MPLRRPRQKTSRAVGPPSIPTRVDLNRADPPSSACPYTYASEAEEAQEDVLSKIPVHALTLSESAEAHAETPPIKEMNAQKSFRFLDLPSELRIEIYAQHFGGSDRVVDLDVDNYKLLHKKLAIMRTCKTIYHEASHFFYSTRTFRLFPTQPGRFFKTKRPLLSRLNVNQRRSLTSLELRLGPGWNKPPRGWIVNPALGLADCVNVRKLTVFVECDPSDGIFNGFRKADGFYETFSKELLDDVLAEMPFLDRVYFDAWSSVKKSGAMMEGLFAVTKTRGRKICWGPERNWTDSDEEDGVVRTNLAAAFLRGLEQQLVY